MRKEEVLSEFGIYLGCHVERSVLRLSGRADCLGNRVSHGHIPGIRILRILVIVSLRAC